MKLLIVSEYYPPYIGGVEIVIKNLAERMVDRGHEVVVITSRLNGTNKIEVRNGVTVHRVPVFNSIDRYSFVPTSIPKVAKFSRWADVIHTTTWLAPFSAAMGNKLRNTPLVITYHELLSDIWQSVNPPPHKQIIGSKLEDLITDINYDEVVSVSDYTKRSLTQKGYMESDITRIYNGIDYSLFDPTNRDKDWLKSELDIGQEFVYLYFGRPGFTKGVEVLVEAAKEVSARLHDTSLVLLLSREPAHRYRQILSQIDKLELSDHIVLLDSVKREDLPTYILGADCVVVPSLTEGFGFTAAEACAMNVPVVATRAGALPEVVSGKHILVEPGDSKSLAEGITSAYKGGLRETSERKFAWEETVNQYEALFQGLI